MKFSVLFSTILSAVEAQEASFATWDPVDPVKVDWGDEDQPAEAAAPAEGDDMYDQSIDSPRVDDATQGAQQATGTKCVALYTYTVRVNMFLGNYPVNTPCFLHKIFVSIFPGNQCRYI